jgi:hypothetical protein
LVERLGPVVRGAREPGVYRWRSSAHPAALRRDLSALGWSLHPLDGTGLTSADRLFDAFARGLSFPGWFRPTWDALASCLVDLTWLPARGHVVLWDRYGALARADAKAWHEAHLVCVTAIAARQRYGLPPLYVLLRGAGPTDPPLI